MTITNHYENENTHTVQAALKGQLDADAEADVSGTHDALIEVDGGKTGGSTITTIFHPGQLKAAAQADADMAGEFGGYGGFLGGKAQLDGSARAGSDLTFGGGHFEMITKTGGDGGHDIDISSKSDLAAKAAAAATGSQAADVYVSGDEGGESFTKMVYVPGKVTAASDANAQLAGHFGGYGMPGSYMGRLTGKAGAQSDLLYDGGSMVFTHHDHSGKAGAVKAALKGQLDADAEADVSGTHDALIEVDGGKTGGSTITTIFHPGQLKAAAQADADMAGEFGGYGGFLGGKAQLDGSARAGSDLTFGGGHFEMITKTGGDGGHDIDISSKSDLAAKAAAAATGSQAADVYVSGDEGGESFTKMVYVPGKVTAASDANAQLAGHFGGYGMPGSYMGRLTGKAGAQSDLLYDGGSMVFTHHDHSGKAGAVKAALKGQLDADAEADVSGTHDALIEVDGGKTGGSTITTIFHPGQLKAAAQADADMAGEFGGYGGFLGGKAQFDGSARAGSDLTFGGGHFEMITKTGGDGGHDIDISSKSDLAAKAAAAATGSQAADVYVSGDEGGESFTKMVYVPGKVTAASDANAQLAGHFGGYGMPGSYMGRLTGKAGAQSDLLYDGGSMVFTHHDHSGKAGAVKAALKGQLDADAEADVSGTHDALIEVDGGKTGGSTITTIFHPGQLKAAAQADADMAGEFGGYGGFLGGKAQFDGSARAGSDLTFGGGHFEMITKTGGDGGHDIDISSKSDLAAKAAAAATGSQAADVYVSGDEGGESFTKMVYVPGKVTAASDANAQLAGHFGGYGMPGSYMGRLTGKAGAQSDLLYDGGSMVFTHHDHSGKAGAVKAALKGQLDADAEADVSGTHDALIEVDGGKTGGSTITTIFHPGQLKAAAQADADMAGEFGGYGGFLGGKAQLDGSARAGSDLTFGGGHFEMITKTGGDGGHDIDISSKSDLAAKAAAAATGSQAADVYVSGDEGGESFTKMVYVPGKVTAASDANAQLAGHFGGYGMPGSYMGRLTGKAGAQSDLLYDGGSMVFTHHDHSGKAGAVKAALKGQLDADAEADVSGTHDALIEVDGGKTGGSTITTIFHPGQLKAAAQADADMAGEFGGYGGFLGGKAQLDGSARAGSDLTFGGGHFEMITKTGGDGGHDIDISSKSDLAAKAAAAATGSQAADVYVSGDEGGESFTKMVYVPGKVTAASDANAQLAGHFGGYGMPGSYMGRLTGKAGAQSDLLYDGGSMVFTHHDHSGKAGAVKAALKGQLDADAEADVSGTHDALIEVDGGKTGGSTITTIFHPGQLKAAAQADADMAGEFGGYGGFLGGKAQFDGSARAGSDLTFGGGHFEMITKTGGDGGHDIDISSKSDLAAKAAAAATGSQAADVCVSDSPACVDESGESRLVGETWYKNGDPCLICSCVAGVFK